MVESDGMILEGRWQNNKLIEACKVDVAGRCLGVANTVNSEVNNRTNPPKILQLGTMS